MSLENIIKEVDSRKQREIEKIRAEYEARRKSIQSQTEKEISSILAQFQTKTEEDSKTLEKREIDAANMDVRRLLMNKKNTLIEESLEKSTYFLRNLRNNKDYGKILKTMVNLSKGLLGKDCIAKVNPEDKGFVEDVTGVKIKTEKIDPYGGVVAISADGTREVNLTISSIIDDLREQISIELYEKIGE